MILVDVNLLVYARFSAYPEHPLAHTWLDERLNDRQGVGLPWESLVAFVRLATNPRIFPRPLTMDQAWEQVDAWLALPNVWVPGPTERHRQTLGSLVRGQGLTSRLVMDAHLAAIAIDHRLVLCSADRDFTRFKGLRFDNPLASPA